ncbi:M28 family peptidase [Oxalobacteraceae bacterium A2-2]
MKSLLLPALLACAAAHGAENISPARLLDHIKVLASDEYEGRAPATKGESMTVEYLTTQLRQLGLEPGNPDGSYVQAVPLLGISSHPTLAWHAGGASTTLRYGDDYVAWTGQPEKQIELKKSELVFVGYGVRAPEFQWDDFKGVDLRGKTLVMLVNDPPVPDPKKRGQLHPAVFGGKAMSYYGRWSYKFEIAAKLGAAGALIIHDTKPAGYPWDVVRGTWSRENFTLRDQGSNPSYPRVAGWLRQDSAQQLFKAAGQDLEMLKKAAQSRDFKPVALGAQLDVQMLNAWRDQPSHNVVAKITGADPQLKDEYVIYSAHWDHFGVDDSLPGPRSQQIFHGARDNASGVAALLEIARAYKALPAPPRRSIVFLLTTAQERGQLGAQYYTRHPLYPLARTLVDINIDGMNVWGRTRDVAQSGLGLSGVDEVAAAAARQQRRVVHADGTGEFTSFQRGDQLEFAKVGVPALYLRSGADFIGKPAGYGGATLGAYTRLQYHTVADTVQPDWDLRGAAEDAALLFQAGYQIAQGKAGPAWKPGSEYKGAR